LHAHAFSTARWSVRGCRCREQKNQQEHGAVVQALSFELLAVESAKRQTITLTNGTGTLSLPLLAQLPQRQSERLQAQGRTVSGTRYVHDSGTTLQRLVIPLAGLTTDERDALRDFHDAVAGSAVPFSLTDEIGDEWQARFADGKLNFDSDAYGLWQTALMLDLDEDAG